MQASSDPVPAFVVPAETRTTCFLPRRANGRTARRVCARANKSTRRIQRRGRAAGAAVCCESSAASSDRERTLEEELQKLEGTTLKWAEIEFASVEDELNAIDEYVREEGIKDDDVWPIFLRGCAYESRGQVQLALAQFSKINIETGLALVPNLWERRAYNTFKSGDLPKARALYDVSVRVLTEAVGNQLHFAHWFDEHFTDFLPRHCGPSFTIQRGICNYCALKLDDARGSLVPSLIVRDLGCEHGVIWLLACNARTDDSAVDADLDIVREWHTHDFPDDLNETLRLTFELFYTSVANDGDPSGLLTALADTAVSSETSGDALIAAIYIALYHDSVTQDSKQRDRWLDRVAEFPGSPKCSDTLDFVYHAAKARFGVASRTA